MVRACAAPLPNRRAACSRSSACSLENWKFMRPSESFKTDTCLWNDKAMSAGPRAPVPDHVPPEMVRDFEWITDASILVDPFAVWHGMHERPEIFWATGLGGHWVLTRA